ncbi:hypothetical protein [Actinomadura roseirufa]|uniref:hypothetical protein n=1 Tax=Actinomadura roseirufa TaxID=2094049 RepID=UPI00104147B8|nr:hypothetical protein [Actinomadura roseirufa]
MTAPLDLGPYTGRGRAVVELELPPTLQGLPRRLTDLRRLKDEAIEAHDFEHGAEIRGMLHQGHGTAG